YAIAVAVHHIQGPLVFGERHTVGLVAYGNGGKVSSGEVHGHDLVISLAGNKRRFCRAVGIAKHDYVVRKLTLRNGATRREELDLTDDGAGLCVHNGDGVVFEIGGYERLAISAKSQTGHDRSSDNQRTTVEGNSLGGFGTFENGAIIVWEGRILI